jgi:hypothetical protein
VTHGFQIAPQSHVLIRGVKPSHTQYAGPRVATEESALTARSMLQGDTAKESAEVNADICWGMVFAFTCLACAFHCHAAETATFRCNPPFRREDRAIGLATARGGPLCLEAAARGVVEVDGRSPD